MAVWTHPTHQPIFFSKRNLYHLYLINTNDFYFSWWIQLKCVWIILNHSILIKKKIKTIKISWNWSKMQWMDFDPFQSFNGHFWSKMDPNPSDFTQNQMNLIENGSKSIRFYLKSDESNQKWIHWILTSSFNWSPNLPYDFKSDQIWYLNLDYLDSELSRIQFGMYNRLSLENNFEALMTVQRRSCWGAQKNFSCEICQQIFVWQCRIKNKV